MWCDFAVMCSEMRSGTGHYHAGWGKNESFGCLCRKDDRPLGPSITFWKRWKTDESAVYDILSSIAVVDCTCRGALIRRWGEKGGGKGREGRPSRSSILEFAQDVGEMRIVSDLSWFFGIGSIVKYFNFCAMLFLQ